jgi:S1-C subfamily serine protease
VKSVQERGVDLGLLKIEPFPNMPHLDALDLDLPAPAPMSEVYLCGFPLGRMAVQDGQVLIASTFKGILSRIVSPYFQIDASVHPGNSGGPVMDTRGRILGIATRVQRTPEGDYTPTIGYITPVQALASIWPPRDGDGAPAVPRK